MSHLAVFLAALAVAGGGKAPPKAPPAAVTVTAELACLHCTFGEGETCAVCLKVDAKTPILLSGKAAKEFHDQRLTKKVITAEGVLTLGKDKRLQLASDRARLADEKPAPAKGLARLQGTACCGQCDLGVCDDCTLAVRNGAFPVILDGKLSQGHAENAKGITTEGRLFVDQRGLVRLLATRVEVQKK